MRRPRMFDETSWVSNFMNRKRFHFFKIIIPANIQQKRLGLPRKFVRKFGKELSKVAFLTVPNGTKWHVELKETEGEIWLENGWQELVDYHSIGVGHFLVFGYDGSSRFHVLIFDMSASEIEYPRHTKDFEEPNQENECQAPSKESESVESLDASPPCPIRAESVKGVSNESERHQTSTMRHLKPKGKCEAPSKEGSDSVEIVDVSAICPKRADLMKEVIDESEGQQKSKTRRLTPRSRLRYSLRSFERKIIRPTFDSHSRCTTQGKGEAPSKEGSDSVKIVDVSPIRPKRADHLMKEEAIDESEGQQKSKMRLLTPRSRLRYSLRSFERKITRPTFDSHSRCTTQVKSSPKRDRNSTKNAEAFSPCQVTESTEFDGYESALQEESSDHIPISRISSSSMFFRRCPVTTTLMTQVARAFKSDNPFYLLIMRSSYVKKPFMLNVPSNFARKYFKQDLYLTLRVSDGRSWRVRCVSVESNAKLAGGSRDFVLENRLEKDDVCVFELVNRHNIEMKVVIHRARS